MMGEHKAELKRAITDNGGGSSSRGYQYGKGSCGGYQGVANNNGDGEQERKRPKTAPVHKERRARIAAKWEKQIAVKLNKPGSRWATTREWHNPYTINWGRYYHTHGYDLQGKTHDSGNCQEIRREDPAEGYNKTTTCTNRKRCSEQFKPV